MVDGDEYYKVISEPFSIGSKANYRIEGTVINTIPKDDPEMVEIAISIALRDSDTNESMHVGSFTYFMQKKWYDKDDTRFIHRASI